MKPHTVPLRLLALLALASAALLAGMSIGATAAAASPGNPVGPSDYVNPVKPPGPDPKPSITWAPEDPQICNPGKDCTPDDEVTPSETPDDGIRTPNRIDTGAGGTAGEHLLSVLSAIAALALIVTSVLVLSRARRQR